MTPVYAKLRSWHYEPFVKMDSYSFDDLRDLEPLLGVGLPDEYAEFLRQFPYTGMFEQDGDVVIRSKRPDRNGYQGPFPVTMLFGACSDLRYDVREVAKTTDRAVIPAGLLQVAEDLSGNAFCLDLRSGSFGKVYFWDHEEPEDLALRLVAENFSEFLENLDYLP